MISDEMRELLSAYVDGELRDADAARVEDVSKRDPELRREIEAYRTLRRKLREWDAAEHAVAPTPALVARTVARAQAMDEMLAAAPARFRFLAPLGVAAALLLAAGTGYLLARSGAPGAPSLPAPHRIATLKPLAPAPDLALLDSALVRAPAPAAAVVRSRIDDFIPCRRALELEEAMRQDEMVRATPPARAPERPTVTPISAEIGAMMQGYAAAAVPSEALVVISRAPAVSRLPTVGAAPLGPHLAQDANFGDGKIYEEMAGVPHDVLAPLGEVWTGVQDGSLRTRVVASSNWIPAGVGEMTKVVWADDIAVPRSSARLEVQDFILGPRARQKLLSAKAGPDAAFRDWLAHAYGGALGDAFKQGAKDRERLVNRLVDALSREGSGTGFGVYDAKGKLLGVELFHERALMLAFAPRLLRGYLLEAGEDGIRIAPPPAGGHRLEEMGRFLDGLPGRSLRVERQPIRIEVPDAATGKTRNGAPDGLARANLVAASGEIVGHGLVIDGTPIHLTLFGE